MIITLCSLWPNKKTLRSLSFALGSDQVLPWLWLLFEKSLDPQLWRSFTGGMVQKLSLNSKVFYFPQGHAEHAQASVDFAASLRIPPLILCHVATVKFLVNPETDAVFAKIKLIPLRNSELNDADGDENTHGSKNSEKPASFAKTLTQFDANCGGGSPVLKYRAEKNSRKSYGGERV